MEEHVNCASLVEDVGNLLDAIGERLGSELYCLVSPALQSASFFRSSFINGFKRGWIRARSEELAGTKESELKGESK